MGTTIALIAALVIGFFWLVITVGQKWGKDSRREEEEEAKIIHMDTYIENDFFPAYKDDDDH